MMRAFSFLTEEGLDNLEHFKFQGGAYTALDNFMNPFWVAYVNL